MNSKNSVRCIPFALKVSRNSGSCPTAMSPWLQTLHPSTTLRLNAQYLSPLVPKFHHVMLTWAQYKVQREYNVCLVVCPMHGRIVPTNRENRWVRVGEDGRGRQRTAARAHHLSCGSAHTPKEVIFFRYLWLYVAGIRSSLAEFGMSPAASQDVATLNNGLLLSKVGLPLFF